MLSVQFSRVRLFATLWTAAHQDSLSIIKPIGPELKTQSVSFQGSSSSRISL